MTNLSPFLSQRGREKDIKIESRQTDKKRNFVPVHTLIKKKKKREKKADGQKDKEWDLEAETLLFQKDRKDHPDQTGHKLPVRLIVDSAHFKLF